jgi:hypothetical protein
MNFAIVANVIGGFLLVFLVVRTGLLAYLYDVKVGETGVNFVLFSKFTFFNLPYSEIEKVKEVGFFGTLALNAVNFQNRSLTKGFLIQKKSGWYTRRIIITPADSAHFKAILAREHIVCS